MHWQLCTLARLYSTLCRKTFLDIPLTHQGQVLLFKWVNLVVEPPTHYFCMGQHLTPKLHYSLVGVFSLSKTCNKAKQKYNHHTFLTLWIPVDPQITIIGEMLLVTFQRKDLSEKAHLGMLQYYYKFYLNGYVFQQSAQCKFSAVVLQLSGTCRHTATLTTLLLLKRR